MAELGIVISLCLLMFIAYRGFSVIFFAPIFALLAASASGLSPLPTYTEIFLPSLAAYAKVFFPFFLLGAVFGKAMDQSGAAESIAASVVKWMGAKNAIPAVVLSCALLTYGGVSIFVVAFAVYPFAASLFEQAKISKRLLPPTIALGAFTITMDALPGTPQIQNAIPMRYFGTDLYAAPVFGITGAILVMFFGLRYLSFCARKAKANNEGFGDHDKTVPDTKPSAQEFRAIHPALAASPLLCVLVVTLVLQKLVFPHWNIFVWATLAPYNIAPAQLNGTMNNWALMISLLLGTILALFLNPPRIKGKLATVINAGAAGSLLAVMNTASEVGFGNVIKALPGFKTIAHSLMGIGRGSGPLLSEAVTVNVLSGITGSASGGMSIALDTFGADYLNWAKEVGLNPELLHRVAAMASGGMDTLPHNGAVITLLAITGMTHRQSYKDIFVITLIKTASVFAVIALQAVFHFV